MLVTSFQRKNTMEYKEAPSTVECSKVGAAAPPRAQTSGEDSLEARPAEHRRQKVWEPVFWVPPSLFSRSDASAQRH